MNANVLAARNARLNSWPHGFGIIGMPLIGQPDRALTFAEADVMSGIPLSKLLRYYREHRLEVFKFGRSVFVSQTSLLRLMESCREPHEKATVLPIPKEGEIR